MPHQGPGVDAGDANYPMLLEPGRQALLAAPAAGPWGQLAGNHPARMGPIGLLVLGVNARIAQFRIGKGDELALIARVGDDLLVAGHAGVEDHFTNRATAGPKGLTAQHQTIGQHQQGRVRAALGRALLGLGLGGWRQFHQHVHGDDHHPRLATSGGPSQGLPQGHQALPGLARRQSAAGLGHPIGEAVRQASGPEH